MPPRHKVGLAAKALVVWRQMAEKPVAAAPTPGVRVAPHKQVRVAAPRPVEPSRPVEALRPVAAPRPVAVPPDRLGSDQRWRLYWQWRNSQRGWRRRWHCGGWRQRRGRLSGNRWHRAGLRRAIGRRWRPGRRRRRVRQWRQGQWCSWGTGRRDRRSNQRRCVPVHRWYRRRNWIQPLQGQSLRDPATRGLHHPRRSVRPTTPATARGCSRRSSRRTRTSRSSVR